MPERNLLGRFPGGPERARRVLPPAVALAVGALAIGAVAGTGTGTSRGATRPSSGGSGATVQRRDLISTDTESGTLGYANPRTVFDRLSGTITGLPQVGATVKPGGVLFDVDGAPVVLFNGQAPAYRSFTSGMSDGPDVAELKRDLIALGFDPGRAITVNDTFDSATQSAIDRWQASLGQAQTGSVTLGQIVFLPGSRRISSVTGVLGSTGSGGGGASAASASTTGASYDGAAPAPEFVSLQTTSTTTTATTTTPTTTTTTTTTPSPRPHAAPTGRSSSPSAKQLLAQLVAELRGLAAGSGSARAGTGAGTAATGRTSSGGASGASGSAGRSAGSASGGSAAASGASAAGSGTGSSGAASASPILSTTSSDLVVTVELDATKQSEAVIGEPVSVQLSDGSSTTGRVTAVSSVATSSASSASSSGAAAAGGGGSSTPSATVPVTVALTGHRHVQGLDQAAVSVNFQQQVERGVLSVPVTALLATAGGGYAVQTVGANPRTLPVTVGLFAGGYVQISGSDISEGLQVSNSQG